MRTTAQWWEEVSQDETKFMEWLMKQYHGERMAATRIHHLMDNLTVDSNHDWRRRILHGIFTDEVKHAGWVGELLKDRGVTPALLIKEERYWKETLPAMDGKPFEYICAVGHLAETMRLDRITLLAADTRYKDVAEVFSRILPDEEFHAKLFGMMSTPEDIAEARKYHNNGLNALGLVA